MPVAAFFNNYYSGNPAWGRSANSGATYTSPATNSNQVVGPVGTERYRHIFTIPAGLDGTFDVTVSGDIFDNSVNTNAQVWYDGVFQGNVVPLAGPTTFNLPVVPGSHTFELRIGGSDSAGAGNTTAPVVSATYNNATQAFGDLCNCCPLNLDGQRCTSGQELLTNGDFEASSGIGATSTVGPGWISSYVPCGPNIFNVPCGAQTFAYFTTNAGQVTGNHPNAVPIPALGTKSMAVNVAGNVNIPVIQWLNIPMVNGRTYRFRCDAAVIGFPFALAIRVDNTVIGPLTAPAVQSVWTPTELEFVWTGNTGAHNVGMFSNSGAAGGNDHTFDNFSLIEEPVPAFPMRCDGTVQWVNAHGEIVDPQDLGEC